MSELLLDLVINY